MKVPLKQKDVDLAHKLALLGLRNKDMARIFDVEERQFERWLRFHDGLRAALKDGREIADAKVAASLYQKACGYSHPDVHISNNKGEITITPIMKHYPPDGAAAMFILKNRHRELWKDKQDVAITGQIGLTDLTDAELEAEKQRLLQAVNGSPLTVVK